MRILLLGGLFLTIISLASIKGKTEQYDVQKNGELIEAVITSVPNCLGTKSKYPFRFIYNGQKFSKDVGCGFADNHKVGEKIILKHIEGRDIFLFESESIENEFVAIVILGLMGFIFIFLGFKSNSNRLSLKRSRLHRNL